MEPIDKLIEGLKRVDALIAEEAMVPDLSRADWSEHRARARALYDAVQSDVLGSLDDALFSVKDPDVAALIKRRVADVLGEAAAPVFATGDTKSFLSLLAKASRVAADDEQRALFDAASAEPEMFCRLTHARWLWTSGRHREADKILKRVAREAERPALKSAARKARNASRPVESMPSLFQLNGCGAAFYGSRDQGSDGSYIATHCVSLLWIPVLPLGAYRVRWLGDGSYQVHTKEVLGPLARAWQAFILAGVVLAVGYGGVTSYLGSPSYRAGVAMDEAKAAEASGDREGAILRFKELARTFEGTSNAALAGESVVRLTAAGVAEPATASSVDQISRVVTGFYDLPVAVRRGAPAELLVSRMCAWSDQIGDTTPALASAGLSLLDMATKVSEDGAEAQPIEERSSKRRRSIAEKVALDRPLLALRHYSQINDLAAQDAARAIIDTFGDAPSLWIEAQPDIERVALGARQLGRGAEATSLQDKLKYAAARHAEDKALIEAADEKAIAKALSDRPADQELAVAVADLQKARGDVKAALATLTKLGAVGRLTAVAQRALGQCLADTGDLERADQTLSALLSERLPLFQQAQREYFNAAQKRREAVLTNAKLGALPGHLQTKLRGASEEEQMRIFGEYMRDVVAGDPSLSALRAEYLRHGAVVPASLSLGTVKLRRAREASGEARRALLADAERAFLSIRAEAEGDPSYHLGLGQVYHRLGRAEDGDKELQGVLDRRDERLTLAVGHIYRELAHISRARQIAEQVYESAQTPEVKHAAARFRSLVVKGLDDEETWLRRSDPASPSVKNALLKNQALRLARDGKLAEADQIFAKVIAWEGLDASTEPAAANNVALCYLTRYTLTGDIAHVKSAVRHLERSVRLSGDNAITLGNLAEALEYLGFLTVTDKWLRTRALMLTMREAESLLESMLSSPVRAEVLDALSKEPSYRKALELTKQEQILAPQKISAYEMELRWLKWSRDEAGLAELEKRLAAMQPISGEDTTEGRRAFLAGELDEEVKRTAATQTTSSKERLARAQKEGHKPTLAAAWLLVSDALSVSFYYSPDSSQASERVSACRSAREAWPEGISDSELASVLVASGVIKATSASEAFGKLWRDEGKIFDLSVVLHHAMTRGAPSDEMVAALRAQPELGEAARLRKASMGERPSLRDWVLSRVMGDTEMEQAAAKVFERVDIDLGFKIEARLYPGQPREEAERALFTGKGKPPSP